MKSTRPHPRKIRLAEEARIQIETERAAQLDKRRRNRAVVARTVQVAAILPLRTASAPTFK